MEKQGKINPEDKPVGYGSSIQSSGYGNKNRPQQPVDENRLPGQQYKDHEKPKEKKS